MWRIVLLSMLVLLAIILTAWFDYIEREQRNGRDTMTIEIIRGSYTWQYRQRPDEPAVLESRPIYRGSPWRFMARFGTADEARQALLRILEHDERKQE
jgi:hypothetical protein